ncbi:class I adenylate-forming enzyme family protein [Actinomadura decatromicini]|uniref:class I adenylate-forming enzyme family protein n=1 Tax=Actinomadura decatromicini TaxID=2604572 RepID=UPI001CA34E36|nr:class I adenylate-forming enzyme family protein [Actinomadura decatromicini]
MTTLFDIIAGHAEIGPDRLALLTEQDGVRTYGELAGNASALAAALRVKLGVPAGARICVWARNRPEWVETYLAAGAAGLATVAANPEWTDAEARYVCAHSDSVAVVCDADLAARAVALAAGIPGLAHVIALSGDEGGAPPPSAVSYGELIATAPPPEARPRRDASASAPLLMYTSGTTTGRPKAVVSEPNAATGIDYNEMFGLTASDRALVVTPFFHGNGFGGLMSALAYGAAAVFPRRFSAGRFWRLVDLYRPTYLFTLAPIVNILMGRPAAWHERTHAFRVLIVLGCAGGAPAIEERFGAPVIDWYGMTEAGMGTYTRLDEPRRPGSAGRPFPGSGMAIVRSDGTPAAPGETGEVVFDRARIGFAGYLKDAEATASALDDRWFHTGDLGYFDDDGYFFFVDRKKDIVRRGGENISSIEVESVLREHPGVAEAAVLAVPDPVLGERVMAFAVASDPAVPPAADEVRSYAGERLAHFKVPEDVVFIERMPRTATGKIEKFRLRERFGESK